MSIHPSEIYQGNLTITDMVTAVEKAVAAALAE